ncbi:hypothetical protein [Gynurincola endophyticus]|uniref:hypothetical protein n=1 Tax=Gynurincola endophyticus TaxID=2479004 RepID=UPI000F8F59D5|nr:hypothetical protein [Gynurincola endophyticus]
MKSIKNILFLLAILVVGCSKSGSNDSPDDQNVIKDTFKEGVIEMGIYSGGADLGVVIDQVNWSADNVREQVENVLNNLSDEENPMKIIQKVSENNPWLAFSLILNMTNCDYYIKDQTVLGKARGMGWVMDNYHNRSADKGSVYIETLVQTDEISDADKRIFATYTPSEDLGSQLNAIDFSNFKREQQPKKENVLNYLCDVTTYTAVNNVPGSQLNLYKIVVYTSSLFDKTINFTHPYYLPEDGGILRLDIYFENIPEPTLVMAPKSIIPRVVTSGELTTRTATPSTTINDPAWGFKALGLLMSGFSVLNEE